MMPTASTDNDTAQLRLASALWHRGDTAGAEKALRELLARASGYEDAAVLLAQVLRNQGRLDAASCVVFDLCRARNFDQETCRRGAGFIQECQRQALADELCREALARQDASPAMWAIAGNVARELGDFERAHACYMQALESGVDLDRHMVLGALARTLRYHDAAHPDFARFIRHFRDESASPRARAATGFGLAKAHDDIGDFESATRILRQANALVRSVQSWDAPAWKAFVESRLRSRVATAEDAGAQEFVPVFVVGLPRTGTTLAATRLAGHSPIRDRGELRTLRFIADTLINGGHLASRSALTEAAQLYRAHAVQDDAPARWYIDQDPLNFRYLDIAAALFPQARIIHCRRSRRDTALSLWSQDFAHSDAGFVYDFPDIAAYAQDHDRLMQHWRQTLSVSIFELDYEMLVSDPERTLRRLCDFVGAPFAVPQFASVVSGSAPINSSSVWQARQPIYATSVGRWRGYMPYVPELAQFPE